MRELVARLWRRWCDHWFEPGPPHSAAIFRILVGAFFLIYWLVRAPHVEFLLSKNGFYNPAVDQLGAFRFVVAPIPLPATWILYIVLVVALLLFTLGWWTRYAAAVYFLLHAYFFHAALYNLYASYDRLFLQVALLMCFSRCDEVFSIKAARRRRRGLPLETRIPMWPTRLIALQGMLVYFGTGVHKVFAPSWHGGEILYNSFKGPWASELGFWIARLPLPMEAYDVFVYGTILFELSAPLGLYVRRLQPFFFAVGFLFHTSIALTISIWQFMAVPATYVLYVDPERVKAFAERLSPRR